MKYDYEETTEDLQTRIDIHSQFGGQDIDSWMLEVLQPQPGISIFDVGCGAGKQLLAFHGALDGQAVIAGGDVNEELLDQARSRIKSAGADIEVTKLDFNQPFDLPQDSYDLVSCCFAIYYADDAAFTIREMHKILKPGGRLFTTGPMPDNKQLFYDIIRDATNQPIPPMPGSSRYDSEILGAIRDTFETVQVHRFENPLRFPSVEPFIEYTRASLSEDRKLWKSFFEGESDFNQMMDQINQAAEKRMAQDGELLMTKVVGGFVATK